MQSVCSHLTGHVTRLSEAALDPLAIPLIAKKQMASIATRQPYQESTGV
jgi:hypothetical protein